MVQNVASLTPRVTPLDQLWYALFHPCAINVSERVSCAYTVFSQSASNFVDPVNGYQFTGITDPVHDVTYGFTFPPLATSGANPTEFIGEVVAPATTQWIGIALGGAMLQDLLLMAWPNAGKIVSSTRFAT